MSGIGHLAAGFAAKTVTPETPLWVLLVAAETNDILYGLFSLSGLEPTVQTSMSFSQGIQYLSPVSNPWSHGLFMSIVWSVLAALSAYFFSRNWKVTGTIGLVVFSHWMLDFLMHSNLPLFFGSSPLLGLGLENSGPGFILITVFDLVLFGSGVAIYFRQSVISKQMTRQGAKNV